ncbi:ABC transporter permease [Streptomyces sp. NPDC059373]
MTSPTKTEGTDASAVLEPEARPGVDAKEAEQLVGLSPGKLMWRRFKRDRTGVVSAWVVIFFFAIAAAAPLISKLYGKDPYTLYGQDQVDLLNDFGFPNAPNGGISGQFWFGLEPGLGRDVFTLLIYGIRTSLMISLVVTVLSTVTAILLGVAAGYLGGRTDYFIGRFIDLLLAFPSQLFFVAFMPIIIAIFVSPQDETPTYLRVVAIILVQWILGWMGLARLLRGTVLSLREREFIEAARVSGAGPWRIITKELLPNLVTPILVQSTLMLPSFVTAEAGLSFLGVGLISPTPDWGAMFAKAGSIYQDDLTFMFFPGISMVIFIVAFNLLGDSVRDAFDPKATR